MNLSYQVRICDEATFLTVLSSYCGIYADEGLTLCLCHFDYERDKDKYTSAHVQVYGKSPALDLLNGKGDEKRPLEKLHFPVGGKRFRPCIEDFIEFLINERLVAGREGWQRYVEAGRNRYQLIQLKAAIRRNPEVVEEYLKDRERAQQGE